MKKTMTIMMILIVLLSTFASAALLKVTGWQTAQQCINIIDDGGINTFVPGIIQGRTDVYAIPKQYKDRCYLMPNQNPPYRLQEFYCSNGFVASSDAPCINGCLESLNGGACKSSSTATGTPPTITQSTPIWSTENKILLDGKNDFITTPITVTQQKFTLSAWVKPQPNPTADYQTIISKNSYYAASTTDFPVAMSTDSTGTGYSCSISNGYDYIPDLTATKRGYTADEWHNPVCTYDGQILKLYVDGQLADQKTGTVGLLSSNSRPYTIGRAPYEQTAQAGKTAFKGQMTNILIYNSAITEAEIVNTYNDKRNMLPPQTVQMEYFCDKSDAPQGVPLSSLEAQPEFAYDISVKGTASLIEAPLGAGMNELGKIIQIENDKCLNDNILREAYCKKFKGLDKNLIGFKEITCSQGCDTDKGACKKRVCTAGWACKNDNSLGLRNADCSWVFGQIKNCEYGCLNDKCNLMPAPAAQCTATKVLSDADSTEFTNLLAQNTEYAMNKFVNLLYFKIADKAPCDSSKLKLYNATRELGGVMKYPVACCEQNSCVKTNNYGCDNGLTSMNDKHSLSPANQKYCCKLSLPAATPPSAQEISVQFMCTKESLTGQLSPMEMASLSPTKENIFTTEKTKLVRKEIKDGIVVSSKELEVKTDSCKDSNTLVENYCGWLQQNPTSDLAATIQSPITSKEINCQHGCLGGACNPTPPPAQPPATATPTTCTPRWTCKDTNTLAFQFKNCNWQLPMKHCQGGCSDDKCNPACKETDGGLDIYNKGKLLDPGYFFFIPAAPTTPIEDYSKYVFDKCAVKVGPQFSTLFQFRDCSANEQCFVQEVYCDKSSRMGYSIDPTNRCIYGCSNGACNKEPSAASPTPLSCVQKWKCKDENTRGYQYSNCDWYSYQPRCPRSCLENSYGSRCR